MRHARPRQEEKLLQDAGSVSASSHSMDDRVVAVPMIRPTRESELVSLVHVLDFGWAAYYTPYPSSQQFFGVLSSCSGA